MYGESAPKLDIKHLFDKRRERDSARLRAYNQILAQIHNRIYTTSQVAGNTNSVVYNVPPFVLGLPAIDLEDCIIYLVSMLRNGGFFVKYTYPNLLYISWKHYEQEYNKSDNPIVKAMLPPAAPTTKKGKEGKRGAGDDTAARVTFAPLPPAAGSPRRSAAEYKPPDSFMNSITRPAAVERAPAGPVGPAAAASREAKATADVLADLWKF